MKKKLIFPSILTVTFFLLSPVDVLAATLGLNPATATLNRGCTVSINVDLNTQGSNTDGTDAILMYDPTRFSLSNNSIRNGTVYPDFPGNVVDNKAGKISISGLSSVASPFTGQGTLATIDFQVLPDAPTGLTSVTFDFDPNDKTKTTDSNVVERNSIADVLNSVTDGKYTIGTGNCTAGTFVATGSGVFKGGSVVATPSATTQPLPPTLPKGGLAGPTLMLALAGVILTVLGVAGLVLL